MLQETSGALEGDLFPFGPTSASFGSSITQNAAGDEFTLLAEGHYRLEFLFQQVLFLFPPSNEASIIQFEKNGVPIGPEYLVARNEYGDIVTGVLLVAASPGDIISLRVKGSEPSGALGGLAGTSLLITQLTSSAAP